MLTWLNTPIEVAVLANDSDPQGDTLRVSAAGFASNGTVAVSAGAASVIYTPATGWTGTDTFFYRLEDGQGGVSTGMVSVVTIPALRVSGLHPASGEQAGFVLRIDSVAGLLYSVLYKNSLLDTNDWLFLTNDLAGTGIPIEISDKASAPHRFYRVKARFP